MTNKSHIRENRFENLLGWLDSDREIAGHKYELIRLRLIKIFYARGCSTAEDLTDEVIDRVMGKIIFLADNYQGNKALYFYSVAKKVWLEHTRKPTTEELPLNLAQEVASLEDFEIQYECLDKCLQCLTPEQREFVIEYYQSEKGRKIDERKELGEKMKISNEAMRIRVFRIRKKLQKCVLNCVANHKV